MNTEKKINVLVYADEGTGEISVHHALNSLKYLLFINFIIKISQKKNSLRRKLCYSESLCKSNY